jgi:hypothetical protein
MSGTLDGMGWPAEDLRGGSRDLDGGSSGPGFLAAPFSARSWRESLQAVVNLPVGVLLFSVVVTLLTAGLATVVTFVGLPLLAVTLAACRGFGAMERARASALLGVGTAAPAPPRADRPGLSGWTAARLKDGAGWRAALYSVLMLPLGILSSVLTVTLWSVALSTASYPLWQWVFPAYVHRPGVQLYQNGNHVHYLSTVPEIAGVCALGVLLVFVTPQLVRGLAGIQRAMVRGLLAR